MPFSEVDICSNALVLLGLEPISALPDGTPRSNTCKVRFPMLKERVLSGHQWKFTMDKALLSRDVTQPISKWKYQYYLPGDRLLDGVVCAYNDSTLGIDPFTSFIIQDGMLLTDEAEVYVDYQKAVAVTDWPSHFVDFAAHALAVDICLALTKSKSIKDQLYLETYGTPSQNMMGGLHGMSRSQDSKYAPANNKITGFSVRDSRLKGIS